MCHDDDDDDDDDDLVIWWGLRQPPVDFSTRQSVTRRTKENVVVYFMLRLLFILSLLQVRWRRWWRQFTWRWRHLATVSARCCVLVFVSPQLHLSIIIIH